MSKNATKERLFEVTGRLDKTFKPKLNENTGDNMVYYFTNIWSKDQNVIDTINRYPEFKDRYSRYLSYDVNDWNAMSDQDLQNLWDEWAKDEQRIQPIGEQVTGAAQNPNMQSQDVTYTDNTYKVIAPILRRVRTVDQFPLAFKGWFSSLGYNPQASPLTVATAKLMVEKVMRELGYK